MTSDLLLTIDDAVNVAINYIHNHCDDYGIDEEDEESIRSEMEQKCWINRDCGEPKKNLVGFLMDVNPVEICSQIQNDTLSDWCESWRAAAQMALMKV